MRFYQVFAFSPSTGLKTTLCSIQDVTPGFLVAPPTFKSSLIKHRRRIRPRRFADEDFVVPDGAVDKQMFDSQESICLQKRDTASHASELQDDPRLRMNWRATFQLIFMGNPPSSTRETDLSAPIDTTKDLLDSISYHINQGKYVNNLAMRSL